MAVLDLTRQGEHMGEIFNYILIYPFINVLVIIYTVLAKIGVPFALGSSIIVLTTLIKLITYPLTKAQLKSAAKMQRVKPHLDKLKDKHKNDPSRLQQETMRLYKEHGVNPAAGCLPLLIQFPIFIALYQVLIRIVNVDTGQTVANINKALYPIVPHLDKAWDPNFFGVSLAANPSQWEKAGVALLAIPLITAGLQFAQSKMMMPKKDAGEKKDMKDAKKEDDFQNIMQTQITYFMPLMFGFLSYTFPVGLSLYFNVFALFSIIQQYQIQRSNE